MNKKLKILLTNDDGYQSKGISHLFSSLKMKYNVTVVAPKSQQSGVGHGFTYKKPIRYNKFALKNEFFGYSVSGTPADCVKFALGHLLPGKPDIVVSGINEGKNIGIANFYSGTIAAAREAAFWRIPSVAFSVCEKACEYFKEYSVVSKQIISKIIVDTKIKEKKSGIFYNVNFPSCHPSSSKGVKITKQSLAFYNDVYNMKKNKNGIKEYWIKGRLDKLESTDDYDAVAIEKDFITVTPLHFDTTAYELIPFLSDIKNIL